MLNLISIQDTKLPSMPDNGREELADYVRRVREQELGISLEAVVQRARNKGFKISRGYISQIENRYIVSPTAGKLQALAAGLGGGKKREEEIFAVARGMSLEPISPTDFASALEAMGVTQLQSVGGPDRLDALTAEDQQEIIAMIEAMVVQKLSRRSQGGRNGRGKR